MIVLLAYSLAMLNLKVNESFVRFWSENGKIGAEESSYFELFFDDLLMHFIKFMEAYQAQEDEK